MKQSELPVNYQFIMNSLILFMTVVMFSSCVSNRGGLKEIKKETTVSLLQTLDKNDKQVVFYQIQDTIFKTDYNRYYKHILKDSKSQTNPLWTQRYESVLQLLEVESPKSDSINLAVIATDFRDNRRDSSYFEVVRSSVSHFLESGDCIVSIGSNPAKEMTISDVLLYGFQGERPVMVGTLRYKADGVEVYRWGMHIK
ncbi:MAG TPA: hypothetical protein VEC36_07480 [Patescibacteria group bacterium]|nr:hypothetical protein [Patescibacteria group bacterium]